MPSSYQKKYWYQFTSLDNKVNVVELWQYTALTLTAEEVYSMGMPFSVQMPDVDHKFQVVRGTGCEINLLSNTDRKFFAGLYHTDMKEFMIKHYIDTVINWVGYLNAELVREGYSEAINYPFQITGNDGFALLDRMHFLDVADPNNPINYTGIKSIFDLIQIALNRVGLPYVNLYISLSTTFTGQTVAVNSTVLHETYIDSANFYDEDNAPETLRKVIESVLAPFGGVITQIGGDIWITDINTIGSGTGTFKKFVQSTGLYVEAVSVNLVKDIGTIGYMGTGSDIEMSGGKNKQVVSYSPYPRKTMFPESLKDLSEFTGAVPAVYSLRDDSSFRYKALTGNTGITLYAPCTFEQSYRVKGMSVDVEYEKDASVCINWRAGTAATKIFEIVNGPNIAISIGQKSEDIIGTRLGRFKGVGIKVSGEAQFWRYWTNGYGTERDGGVRSAKIKILLRIGSRYGTIGYRGITSWRGSPGTATSWFDAVTYDYITISKSDLSNIAGEWMPFEVSFINSEDLSGQVYFEIYSELNYTDDNGKEWVNTSVHHAQIRMRNLSVTLIDNETGDEIGDSDIEYIGYLDKSLKEEAEKIDLICGTDSFYIDRGKIMKSTAGKYSSIKAFTRNSQSFKIEELLLASLSANYRFGYITLSNLKLQNGLNQLNVITDTAIISDKKFMVNSLNINYRDNVANTGITEVSADNLVIVPQ